MGFFALFMVEDKIYVDIGVWEGLYGIEECRDPVKNKIFSEELINLGLQDRDIELITPEKTFE